MRSRLILPVVVLIAILAFPAAASAKSRYRLGIGDQSASVFSTPTFQALKLKRIRYIVPWDWDRNAGEAAEYRDFITIALANRFEPFVHFTATRGCWDGSRYSKSSECRAPSVRAYRAAFKRFRAAFPQVKVFGTWNEANHKSQPTYKRPKKAAKYFNAMRKACRSCTIVAADLLDSSNLVRYVKKFRRFAKGEKIFGLHNYSDVNRKRAIKTKQLLRRVPGQVWLTETGGIVSFTAKFPYSESRAKSRTKYMFKLADRYSRKRKGMKSRITRVYPYQYTGVERGSRFDAGLVNPDGSPRKAYKTFKAKARTRSK